MTSTTRQVRACEVVERAWCDKSDGWEKSKCWNNSEGGGASFAQWLAELCGLLMNLMMNPTSTAISRNNMYYNVKERRASRAL